MKPKCEQLLQSSGLGKLLSSCDWNHNPKKYARFDTHFDLENTMNRKKDTSHDSVDWNSAALSRNHSFFPIFPSIWIRFPEWLFLVSTKKPSHLCRWGISFIYMETHDISISSTSRGFGQTHQASSLQAFGSHGSSITKAVSWGWSCQKRQAPTQGNGQTWWVFWREADQFFRKKSWENSMISNWKAIVFEW